MLTTWRYLLLIFFIKIAHSAAIQDMCSDIPYSNLCVQIGSKHYLIDGESKLSWFAAEQFCRRQNGFLVTIDSADELRSISEYLISKNYHKNDEHLFWISGNDLATEGLFYSIQSGHLLPFIDWAGGQPDNYKGNEDCVHLWKAPNIFEMNDRNCNDKINFICELESFAYRLI